MPLAKAFDDAVIAIYQNGEPLMPGSGFPMRLVVPGYEGNKNIKFLRRIELTDYYESQAYTTPLLNGKAYRFFSYPKSNRSSPALLCAGAARS